MSEKNSFHCTENMLENQLSIFDIKLLLLVCIIVIFLLIYNEKIKVWNISLNYISEVDSQENEPFQNHEQNSSYLANLYKLRPLY